MESFFFFYLANFFSKFNKKNKRSQINESYQIKFEFYEGECINFRIWNNNFLCYDAKIYSFGWNSLFGFLCDI